MCPMPMWLWSPQGVRCCLALECVLSKQPGPGGRQKPPRSSRATVVLCLCLLHITPSTFPKWKRSVVFSQGCPFQVTSHPNSFQKSLSQPSSECFAQKNEVFPKSLTVRLPKCLRLFFFISLPQHTDTQICTGF